MKGGYVIADNMLLISFMGYIFLYQHQFSTIFQVNPLRTNDGYSSWWNNMVLKALIKSLKNQRPNQSACTVCLILSHTIHLQHNAFTSKWPTHVIIQYYDQRIFLGRLLITMRWVTWLCLPFLWLFCLAFSHATDGIYSLQKRHSFSIRSESNTHD